MGDDVSYEWSRRLDIINMFENFVVPTFKIEFSDESWKNNNCTEPQDLFECFINSMVDKGDVIKNTWHMIAEQVPEEYIHWFSQFCYWLEERQA